MGSFSTYHAAEPDEHFVPFRASDFPCDLRNLIRNGAVEYIDLLVISTMLSQVIDRSPERAKNSFFL